MAGYREKVIHLVNKGVNLIPTPFLQKLSGQKLILPLYHTISDKPLPHIRNLYQVKDTKAFINDLDFLLRNFNPIDYFTFKELSENNKKPAKPSFLLSFDDGLSEFHDVIAPILLQKGVPAICFLNSSFVDNKDLFYRYKASLLVENFKRNKQHEQVALQLLNEPRNVVQKLLSISYQEKNVLDEIAQKINFSFADFLVSESPYLTSNQIRSLIKLGFHFGGHSANHPEYQYINLEEQVNQTKESVRFVCERFALDYKIFAFPFTDYLVSGDFFRRLNKEKIADFTFGSAGLKADKSPRNFQRISLELANLSGRKIINAEFLYYLLKMPFGKNLIKRL
jgi:peptidoglycan/xylan/chitin deacetylase (PgdA/CDA1 family)